MHYFGHTLSRKLLALCFLSACWPVVCSAAPQADAQQEDSSPRPSTEIDIPDEPKTIDPATLLPAELAESVTVTFKEASLSDVVQWIQQEQNISVLLDRRALDEAGILSSEPISDSLTADPLYLLLNRLRTAGLSWYVQDGIVHITTTEGGQRHLVTESYNIGDLFDAGFEPARFTGTLDRAVAIDSWESMGGTGSYILLGDVLFVRQSDAVQREVEDPA